MAIDCEASSSQGLSIPASSQPRNRGALTMAAWVNRESASNANIMGWGTNNGGVRTSNTRAAMKCDASDGLGSQLRAPDSGSRVDGVGSAGYFTPGFWHLAAAVWDVAGDSVRLLHDAVTIDTPAQSYTNAATDDSDSAGGALMCEEDLAGGFHDGVIGWAAVWSRALTDDELSCPMNSLGASMIWNGLLSCWNMTEGGPGAAVVASGVKDAGISGVDLSPVGSPIYAERIFRRRRGVC